MMHKRHCVNEYSQNVNKHENWKILEIDFFSTGALFLIFNRLLEYRLNAMVGCLHRKP